MENVIQETENSFIILSYDEIVFTAVKEDTGETSIDSYDVFLQPKEVEQFINWLKKPYFDDKQLNLF